MDAAQLAHFLRSRREQIQPADVGLATGPWRRTPGLRREEVAALAAMSVDYYTRLEQQRGPRPSVGVVAALARALRLTRDEADHLWRLAGHQPPPRFTPTQHVSPALLRILDSLDDIPAMVVSDLEETLAQNRLAIALVGDHSALTGPARSLIWRWFLDPASRRLHPDDFHAHHSRELVSDLRAASVRRGGDAVSTRMIRELLAGSTEFRGLWARHDVQVLRSQTKRIVHPDVGMLELECLRLVNDDDGQRLLLFTAPKGSETAGRLRLLSVIGSQRIAGAR